MSELFTTLNHSLWVWLATDVLLWALFVLFLFSLWIIVRSPLQRVVWQKVFRQRLAVVSAVLSMRRKAALEPMTWISGALDEGSSSGSAVSGT